MIRFLSFLALLVAPLTAHAQEYDLSTLPETFEFTSSTNVGEQTTVRFTGMEDDLFRFEVRRISADGQTSEELIFANQASRAVRLDSAGGSASFSPEDCAPGIGFCTTQLNLSDGTSIPFSRIAYRGAGMEVYQTFVTVDGEEFLYSAGCVSYDDWGFAIDEVRIDGDGVQTQRRRITSSHEPTGHIPFDDLLARCERLLQ